MAKNRKRDKYGRYKGKAGIKPYKSNLTGKKRKRVSKKKVAAAAVVAAVAVHQVGKRKLDKDKQIAHNRATTITIGANRQLSKKQKKARAKAKANRLKAYEAARRNRRGQ